MSNILIGLIVMTSITVLMILGQAAILEINPQGPQFYACKGSILEGIDANACNGALYVLNDQNSSGQLPSTTSSVSPTTGNVFTDTPTTAKNWLLQNTGLGYLFNLLGAPYYILNAIGLPNIIAFTFGAMWYGIMLLLIILLILGRND